MLRENGNKIFVGLFGGAMLVLALLMFVGCGEDPVCTDTGVDMDTLIETGETGTTETGTTETGETGTTGATETGDTGTTGTTETGDTGMTATE